MAAISPVSKALCQFNVAIDKCFNQLSSSSSFLPCLEKRLRLRKAGGSILSAWYDLHKIRGSAKTLAQRAQQRAARVPSESLIPCASPTAQRRLCRCGRAGVITPSQLCGKLFLPYSNAEYRHLTRPSSSRCCSPRGQCSMAHPSFDMSGAQHGAGSVVGSMLCFHLFGGTSA